MFLNVDFSWGTVEILETKVTLTQSDLINCVLKNVFSLNNNPLLNHSFYKRLVWEPFQTGFSLQMSVFTVPSTTQTTVILQFLFTLPLPRLGKSSILCLNFSWRVSANRHSRNPLSNRSMKFSAVISRPKWGTHKIN